VHIDQIRLVNFRSYGDAAFAFGPRLTIVVGANASGKTNLLEGVYFGLRAGSPRTSRDERLVRRGAGYLRVELQIDGVRRLTAGYSPREGKRVALDGVVLTSLQELRRVGQVFIFVPESLLLVKGGPARRRAHVDAFGTALDGAYGAASAAFQAASRQRNAQLLRVRAGAAGSSLDPWDAQVARTGVELGARRRDLVNSLRAPFARFAAALSPAGGSYDLMLRSSLAELDYDAQAYLDALRERRPREVQAGAGSLGPQRDDVLVAETGADGGARDLRMFGSQGEQRAGVLALLLAEQEVAQRVTGDRGTLLLDDVMSELDDDRRRLLVRGLGAAGQALITTTTTMYFTAAELAEARIIRLGEEGPA